MRTIAVLLTGLVLAGAVIAESPLEAAARNYDLDAAEAALTDLRAQFDGDKSDAHRLQLAEALLLGAELRRIAFEDAEEGDGTDQDALGQAMDAAAEEAMDLAQSLPSSSEKYRILADLQAVMIRSKYRAKRYQKRLQEFIDQALALDARNARAWVSKAKPLVFADADQGGDLDGGIASLDKALALDPALESAQLLKAHALRLQGNKEAARNIWQAVLEDNPHCRPAQRALKDE